jgi:23S rRNA (uracil1939-C5)-methyltransferase
MSLRAHMKRGDELRLAIESFAFEGKSVARLDGMVVFVRGGVPGDDVRAQVVKVKAHYAEAEAVEILTRSALRTEPRCKYFGTCGGCKWQHVDYGAQLAFKRQHVIDALERLGGFQGLSVNPTLGADDIYFYRNKMEFSFGDKWVTKQELMERETAAVVADPKERFALGMHIPGRFDKVLDLDECWLQSESSNRILNLVRSFAHQHALSIYSTFTHTGYLRNLTVRQSAYTGELMVNLVTNDDRPEVMRALTEQLLQQVPAITTVVNNITQRKSQVAIGDMEVVYHGSGFITERIARKTFRISANSFFQTNTKQAERLYDVAARLAQLRRGDVVYDLYSGTGTIALHIADSVEQVIGIEVIASAIEDARLNATLNNNRNCVFLQGDLKETLTGGAIRSGQYPPPDVAIIDPPRAGVHEKVIREIVSMGPGRIVYVSCNPSTQARDLKIFCQDFLYRLTDVQPVDMFPHTYHIENVVALTRVVSG